MTNHEFGMHHLHRRKRIHLKHEPYPHPDKFKRFLDKAIYFVAMIGPVLTLPQIAKIWVFKNAAGVSLISWATYLFCAVAWLLYGICHKDKPIIVSNAIWILLDISIVIGVVVYGQGFL